MQTMRRPAELRREDPPHPRHGVSRLDAAPRYGRLRSWGLLLGAVVCGLLLAVVGHDRPTLVHAEAPALGSAATPPPDVTGGSGTTPNPGATVDRATPIAGGAVVHVVGAVPNPGVLTLPVGARVADAVAAAGGALPGTDLSDINLARRVNDGEQIVVGAAAQGAASSTAAVAGTSAAGGVGNPGAAAGASAGGTGVVNLNQASSEELQQLPRVGPATAAKILSYRESNGPFTSVDQLLEVPGIGEGTLAGLRDLVTV